MKITVKPDNRVKSIDSRKTKWRVRFSVGGKEHDKRFDTKYEAEKYARQKESEFKEIGRSISAKIDDRLKREVFESLKKLEGTGKSISDAVDFYVSHLKARKSSQPVDVLTREFVSAMRGAGKSDRYVLELNGTLKKFEISFGDQFASDVSTRELSEWISGLKVKEITRNNYRRVLSSFFSWCESQGFVQSNPVSRVPKAKAVGSDTEVFIVPELDKILSTLVGLGERYHDVLAAVLIGAFAGLRSSEITRLDWDDVKADRGFIDLSKVKTKTAQRRLVDIQPVLFEWIEEFFAFESGSVLKQGHHKRTQAFKQKLAKGKGGVLWKHNGLRHSFASYLLAKTEDPGMVSLQLGHSDVGLVYRHYRELVTKDEANAYWSLGPSVTKRSKVVMMAGV